MNEPTNNTPPVAAENVITVAKGHQAILAQLHQLDQDGAIMEERLAAALAIERGKLARQVKGAIASALIEEAGKPLGKYEFAPDFSALKPLDAPAPPPVPAAPLVDPPAPPPEGRAVQPPPIPVCPTPADDPNSGKAITSKTGK